MSDWPSKAGGLMLQFVREHPRFLGEDINHYVESVIGPPTDPNMWGGVFQWAIVKKGYAVPIGVESTKKKSSNSRLSRRWVSTLCVPDGQLVSIKDQLHGIRMQLVARKITLDEALRQAYIAGASTI